MLLPKKKLELRRFMSSDSGVIELAKLLEQAIPSKRDELMVQIREQEADLYFDVMKKLVFFEELIYLDEGVLAEILSVTPMKVLAYALCETESNFRQRVTKLIGHREQSQLRDEIDKMGSEIAIWLVLGARKQIHKIARHLEEIGKIEFQVENSPRLCKKVSGKTNFSNALRGSS